MSNERLSDLSPEDKQRVGYIEGKEELWSTKLLTLSGYEETTDGVEDVLVATRDPGSANALLPVIKKLELERGVRLTAITDGRAEEILRKNFDAQEIDFKGSVFEYSEVVPSPKVILLDPSASEGGIDTYVTDPGHFPDAKVVLVEDYYGTAVRLLTKLRERGLPFPASICVMDKGAKDLLARDFPEIADRIEVTGQPSFDKFALEDTNAIALRVREKLGIKPEEKLVSYMSTIEEPEKIEKIAEQMKASGEDFVLAFRRHPRDNVSYETYRDILQKAGVKFIDTNEYNTDEIGAASDVVITTWSTAGIDGIYRRKPTLHIVDDRYRVDCIPPLVPVSLGASSGIDRVEKLGAILPQLLNSQSELNIELRRKMDSEYPVDGKNSERVVVVIKKYL